MSFGLFVLWAIAKQVAIDFWC
jgi:hypothetical protein